MKNLGYLLITIGFIAASYITVIDVLEVNWMYFGSMILISVVGIFMVRSTEKQETFHEETLTTNMKTIEDSLELIVKDVKRIRSEINEENPQEVHHKIDEELPGHLEAFVDSRKTIGHVHGLEKYANVMNYFATAERYLNRVWSASTDGYIDEIKMYIVKSEEQFELALQAVRGLR
ncbi:MAG: hypothetical protein D8M58_09045 [Calditrichaeota bacterium]|nr:MAG: hypothetical protein DWQ03_17445 [Calditrichota bacterium]MBL1205531.1 hypothetical protein [Calditrichota bacterium]NOG45360.1 hypothetical protein [Calditrichota bacterium]